MAPRADALIERGMIDLPVIGFYDAPDAAAFAPTVTPGTRRHACLFAFFDHWKRGETLHLTAADHGCGGCGRALFGVEERSREELLSFLVDTEGLKASRALMERWLSSHRAWAPEHGNVFIGPLRDDMYDRLVTATFLVDPDRLALLVYAVHYESTPEENPVMTAPFGSGCMQFVGLFEDLDAPKAMIGATDVAMRRFLPPEILAVTVTKPMYERLCRIDEKSFLYKPFWKNLMAARAGAPGK
ncbi:MAG: DUF169 domain-containing protein [Candidatus Krumholzibacteriota bacterium]|nr:DUF169 domain-containing protein [Candidatus Krumholzibacteriota bacterium]